jgi:hypothetical protein
MFQLSVIIWTLLCACWAWKGFGWPVWQSNTSTTWQNLGPMARFDDSSLPLVGLILLWVVGMAIMVSLKGRRP